LALGIWLLAISNWQFAVSQTRKTNGLKLKTNHQKPTGQKPTFRFFVFLRALCG
jgi:hypothetical protein